MRGVPDWFGLSGDRGSSPRSPTAPSLVRRDPRHGVAAPDVPGVHGSTSEGTDPHDHHARQHALLRHRDRPGGPGDRHRGLPLFQSIQKLARLGVRIAFEVAPSRIVATITVTAEAVKVLPALLEEIDDARPGSLPDGKLVVTGSMCEGNVTLRVLIPQEWVTAEELAVLTGTADADPSDLL